MSTMHTDRISAILLWNKSARSLSHIYAIAFLIILNNGDNGGSSSRSNNNNNNLLTVFIGKIVINYLFVADSNSIVAALDVPFG